MLRRASGSWGRAGYTGRELARLLSRHPRARIAWATSESDAGKALGDVIPGVDGPALVRAEDADLGGADCVVSCLPHGDSARWMERARAAGARGIDLSADLRVPDEATPAWARSAVYGLPELHRERIAGAELIANPGCYPTAALLALAPLLRRGLVAGPVIVNAASGVTGAGRSPKRELLFAEVAEGFSAYAVGNVHRHLREMRAQAAGLGGRRGAGAGLHAAPAAREARHPGDDLRHRWRSRSTIRGDCGRMIMQASPSSALRARERCRRWRTSSAPTGSRWA